MRTKILGLCITCTLLALFLQSIFFRHSASAIISRQESDASLKSLTAMQDEIYLWIRSYESDLIKIYNEEELVRDLGGGLSGDYLEATYKRAAYAMALAVFEPSQSVNALYLYTVDNRLISSYRSASTPRINYPQDIYTDAEATNGGTVLRYVRSDDRVMLVSSYFNTSRQRDLIRFVLKVYSNNATRKIGYIVCDVDSAIFLRIMEKYAYSERQVVWLQPAGDRPALRLGEPQGEQAALYGMSVERVGASTWAEQDSRPYRGSVLFHMPQERYNLISFSLMPQFLLEENQGVLTRNMLVIAFIVVVVAVASATLITRSLTTPLQRMVGTLKQIRGGQMQLRLSGLRSDEVGELGQAINEMLDRIQVLISQVYDARILLQEAEYKALQAQVNPHFLYNTLDTMGSIATSQQCHTVGTLCQAMSNIFRYCIDIRAPMSTLGAEIVHLKNYMYVMGVRMQNSVVFDIDVDRALLGQRIPRLTLQPVVENALSHGLSNKRGDKWVGMKGSVCDDVVLISISDNGVGMDAVEISRRIQDRTDGAAETDASPSSGSIGLRNIDARIKLLFGQRFGVRVQSTLGEGSVVSLTIPRDGLA